MNASSPIITVVDGPFPNGQPFPPEMLELSPREFFLSRPTGGENVDERATRRSHRSSGALGSLAARSSEPRGDDCEISSGEIDSLVADSREYQDVPLAVAELTEQFPPPVVGRFPTEKGNR